MLNVAAVLEGSVRRSGQRIRITTQLIDAASDSHLWSQTYDRTLDDILARLRVLYNECWRMYGC